MVAKTLEEAFKIVDEIKEGGLHRNFEIPSAMIVLADEVRRLQDALRAIAYPRRGTEEELWGIKEIAEFSALFVNQHP